MIDRPRALVIGAGFGGIAAALRLRAKGYRGVYMLLGGLDAWMDEVLFPAPPAEGDPAFARRRLGSA